MRELSFAKERLAADGYTCVLCRDETVYTSTHRGVKPLVMWLESGEDLGGFCAADKVVGKATAFLYVLLGVRAVYAQVISEPALAVLTAHGVAVQYDQRVEYIINRQGDGVCPFEAAVATIDDPSQAYQTIRATMTAMYIL